MVSQFTNRPLDIAYLTAVGGLIIEFVSGVFFWLYNRTLQQINLFCQGIMSQQTEALTAIRREDIEAHVEARATRRV